MKKFLSSLVFVIATAASASVTRVETGEYSTVYAEIQQKAQKYGTQNVLVVFDVDNTLLVNQQDLGTDQWFEWQRELIEAKHFEHAVAPTFGGLIETQALLYSMGKMRETEAIVSDYVGMIQKQGIRAIVLTARDGANRDSTLRELSANGMNFRNSGIGANHGFAGRYLPYDLTAPEKSGFTAGEAAQWKLKAAREVSYTEGVFFVAGQHKGALLRTLLHKTGQEFPAIVFVDDKVKNTSDMGAAFEEHPSDVTTIRYSREDENVAKFVGGPKDKVIQDWKMISAALKTVFGR